MPRETLISATQYRQLRRLLYPGSESGTALSLLTLDNIITLGTYQFEFEFEFEFTML